jgi:predicted lipid-binding transport protein (Tim44 family)
MGGMIGGMLFRSLGFAGGEGAMGGGIGSWTSSSSSPSSTGSSGSSAAARAQPAANAPGPAYREAPTLDPGQAFPAGQAAASAPPANDVETGLRHLRQLDPRFDVQAFRDHALDLFFKIQGAWANRDMAGVRNLLTDEMARTLGAEAERLKAQGQINRLENIAVRSVEIAEVWQEQGEDFITVKITANLLDYTVDEKGGALLAGSKSDPVKFCEYWTLTRPVGDHPWRLSAIHQGE